MRLQRRRPHPRLRPIQQFWNRFLSQIPSSPSLQSNGSLPNRTEVRAEKPHRDLCCVLLHDEQYLHLPNVRANNSHSENHGKERHLESSTLPIQSTTLLLFPCCRMCPDDFGSPVLSVAGPFYVGHRGATKAALLLSVGDDGFVASEHVSANFLYRLKFIDAHRCH